MNDYRDDVDDRGGHAGVTGGPDHRTFAEAARIAAEELRRLAEEARALREDQRNALETVRLERERLRDTAETARAANEATRVAAETARTVSEYARHAAETARQEVMEHVRLAVDGMTASLEQMKVIEDMRRTLRDVNDLNGRSSN